MPRDRSVFPGAGGIPLPGIVQTYVTTFLQNPVGVEITIDFLSGYWTRITSAHFSMDFAQTVTTPRYAGYHISDGNSFIVNVQSDIPIMSGPGIPSLGVNAVVGVTPYTVNRINNINLPLPDLWLPDGAFFQTNCKGLASGGAPDHYTGVQVSVQHIDITRFHEWYGDGITIGSMNVEMGAYRG